jgi:DNA-binding beta-propeller fold protein YncE
MVSWPCGHSRVMHPRLVLSGWLVVGLLTAGCNGGSGSPSASALSARSATGTTMPGTSFIPRHAAPAEPGRAAAAVVPPVGKVVPIGNAPEGIVVGTSGLGAVAVRNPDGVEVFDATTGAVRQTVPTFGAARHLELAGSDGPVIIPLEASNELSELALADGHVLSTVTGVGRQPHDAANTASGTIVVTNELGGGVVFVRGGAVLGSLPAGPFQPGGVAAVGDYAAVADVQGNGVWVYDGTTRQQVAQAPVGVKLTHAVGLTGDLAAFADTDGGAILIERIDPQITQVAKIDAPGNPYGLAYDALRHRLFVTLTTSNVLRVSDLADPTKPRILGEVPTVQQPNSVAVDPRSGGVLVTGSDPDGSSSLQIITPDLLPTG